MTTNDKRRTLSVTHDGGTRWRIGVRGHEVVVDQPLHSGGTDTAPTPTELFVASVAACAAFYGRTYLARRGLPDRVDVSVDWEPARSPDRVGRISLDVRAPGLPADKKVVFRRVVEACLVHNTLEHGCEIAIDVHSDSKETTAVS